MTSSLSSIATRLAGVPVHEVVPASHGGNSRVYMAASAERLFALKQYPETEHDLRDRLNTERDALELMSWHGIHTIPELIAAESPYALMSWVDGSVITQPKEVDIDEAAVFLGTLHHISKKVPKDDMPMASEACVSGQGIVDQLQGRVATLMPIASENKSLMQFLSQKFLPTFTKRYMAAKKLYPGFATALPHSEQTLIAADFGFHNIMRGTDGRIYFIDFEYFGWDDPVKLMCDFLLHPATTLPEPIQKRFYEYMVSIYGQGIVERFHAYYPLFGLRWALILLNEFIPERWQQRLQANPSLDWETAKTAQLAKAEAMLARSEKF